MHKVDDDILKCIILLQNKVIDLGNKKKELMIAQMLNIRHPTFMFRAVQLANFNLQKDTPPDTSNFILVCFLHKQIVYNI